MTIYRVSYRSVGMQSDAWRMLVANTTAILRRMVKFTIPSLVTAVDHAHVDMH